MKWYKGNKGSTLIEALNSVAIVGVGSLGLINLQSKMIRSGVEASHKNEAIVLAKAKIEELRNYTTTAGYTPIGGGADTPTGSTVNFNRAWTVADNATPNYKDVNVTVSWTKRDGITDSVTVGSNIALFKGRQCRQSNG